MNIKYVFKIDGMPTDREYNAMPFGRQLEHRDKIAAFKASSKHTHFSCKGKAMSKAIAEFKRLYRPSQWLVINTDGPYYHDDSFKIWYTV